MNREEKIEKIKQLERELYQLRQEINPENCWYFGRLSDGERYYSIRTTVNGDIEVRPSTENGEVCDNVHFWCGNYFTTKQQAQEVADKINAVLQMKRLQNELCCGYVPNWGDVRAKKYYVYYDYFYQKYVCGWVTCVQCEQLTYFPDEHTAEKVCDILNQKKKDEMDNV